jgi:ABC-2 type transport system permease protein
MNRFTWLVRREFWEHRAIWIAPAIVLAVMLLGAVTGNVFLGDVTVDADITLDGSTGPRPGLSEEDVAELSSIRGPEDLHKLERLEKLDQAGDKGSVRSLPAGEALALVPPEKRQALLTVIYVAVSIVMFLVLGIIGFFYSLDALYSDRRDRSILFWKSLPLSDAETVLAKFAVAAIAIPLIAGFAGIAAQLIIASGGSLKLGLSGGDAGLMWMPQVLGGSALATLAMAFICALWYAPVTAYLLLASAWAPKSPFLWAVLPPIALSMLEKIAFGSAHVSTFLKNQWVMPFRTLFQSPGGSPGTDRAAAMVSRVTELLFSPEMLLGLAAAAALLAATIWVRRYRDETI